MIYMAASANILTKPERLTLWLDLHNKVFFFLNSLFKGWTISVTILIRILSNINILYIIIWQMHPKVLFFVRQDRKLLPGCFRFQDARRPKMSKYSHRCCFPAWGIMGSRVISTSTPVISTTTSVSVWKETKSVQLYDKVTKGWNEIEISIPFNQHDCRLWGCTEAQQCFELKIRMLTYSQWQS